MSSFRTRVAVAIGLLLAAASGSDFLVSGAKLDQYQPAISFNGQNCLVTWTDARDFETDTSSNIYACRVTPQGQVLDTAGLLIARSRRDQMVPRVAYSGADHLVIWQEGC